MDNLHLKIEGEQKELVIRSGEALELKAPLPLNLSGRIDSVTAWLRKRKSEINEKNCNIIVNYDKLAIFLTMNERDADNVSSMTAALTLSEEFKKFGINGSKEWEPAKLSEFIKMNRSYFVSKEDSSKLVSDFKNFKAKVDKVIEKSKDQNGSYDEKRSQAVTTNLPANFKICIPVFKGEESLTLDIEVYIDSQTLVVTLVSPEANEFIQTQSRSLMDAQITLIEELCPDIAIIYQ